MIGSYEQSRRERLLLESSDMTELEAETLAAYSMSRKRVDFFELARLISADRHRAALLCSQLQNAGLIEPLRKACALFGFGAEAYEAYRLMFDSNRETVPRGTREPRRQSAGATLGESLQDPKASTPEGGALRTKNPLDSSMGSVKSKG